MRNTISVIGVTLRGLDSRSIMRLSSSGGTTVIDGLLMILYNSSATRPMMGAKALGRWGDVTGGRAGAGDFVLHVSSRAVNTVRT